MGKTQSKPLEARHGRGTAWERYGMCELVLRHNFGAEINLIVTALVMFFTSSTSTSSFLFLFFLLDKDPPISR
jgi:hypothetical protein